MSYGRFVLEVGIGAPDDREYLLFGENLSKKVRGKMLDEGLEMITGMWAGEPFSYKGKFFQIKNSPSFYPTPFKTLGFLFGLEVFGIIKNYRPFRGAAKWDGVIPILSDYKGKSRFNVFKDIKEYIQQYRNDNDEFDIVNIETIPQSKSKLKRTL